MNIYSGRTSLTKYAPWQWNQAACQSFSGSLMEERKSCYIKFKMQKTVFLNCLVSRPKFPMAFFFPCSISKDRNCMMLNRQLEETTGFRESWHCFSVFSYCFSSKHCFTFSLNIMVITFILLTTWRNYPMQFCFIVSAILSYPPLQQ